MNYCNENDPKAAAWLRELIKAELIPAGDVDERSICDVKSSDLHGYTQCHFFAGIGGWPRALQLAGWPAGRPIWTGSCPCQPFSCAGKRMGTDDERHLWPYFRNLIGECRPAIVFGEQVASKDGREWLSGIRAEMESAGYAFGASDLCAASVGAPHPRQRFFWVADSQSKRFNRCTAAAEQTGRIFAESSGGASGMADSLSAGLEKRNIEATREEQSATERSGANFWDNFDVIQCADGKARRIESGTFPLANGVSGRVGLLRGYGNAILPEVAAEFVKAYIETLK